MLTVTQVGCGDARYYIPCLTGGFGGSINIDGTNKKVGGRDICGIGGQHVIASASRTVPLMLAALQCPLGLRGLQLISCQVAYLKCTVQQLHLSEQLQGLQAEPCS